MPNESLTMARSTSSGAQRTAPVRLHVGRLALLALLLVAAAFYVSPLRAFFAQQDRYRQQAAVLAQEKSQNVALRDTLAKLKTGAFIQQQAREQFQLVPGGMQVFVVKGLPPGATPSPVPTAAVPSPSSPSLAARLSDLWKTLLQ